MKTLPEKLQLHFQNDGRLLLIQDDGTPPKEFPSLDEALKFAHSLSPHSDYRLTVFDHEGREIIKTFV